MSLCGAWPVDPNQYGPTLVSALSVLKFRSDAATEFVADSNFIVGVTNDACLTAAEKSPVMVAFDGVLFARERLRQRLDLARSSETVSDAALIALAYERWGEAFAAEIDGEFAFAIFDSRKQTLILGRDVVGKGSLYYTVADQRLCFCSELRGLFTLPGIRPDVDDEALVRFMAIRTEEGRTLFRSVLYPPPAHVVVFELGKPERVVKIWSPEQQALLRVNDPREYAEALHEALLRAVELRVPAEGAVASQLSSGFDSSGITALLAQVMARQNRPLLAYTSVPTHTSDASSLLPGWFSDEWPLAHQVAAMYPNIEHIPIGTGDEPWMPALDAMTEVYCGQLFFIRNTSWMWNLQRHAQARGASVLFNGQVGNLTSSYDGYNSLFDLRRRRDWKGLVKALRWRRSRGAGWHGLLARTWMPSADTRTMVRRMIGKKVNPFYEHCLIRREFYRSTSFPELAASPLGNPVVADRRNSAASRLSIMRIVEFGGVAAGERRLFGMRRADPTSDRGVIELCFAIPDEAYLMGGQPRDLYRHAMRDVLPRELLSQTGGGLQSSDFLENFGEGIEEFRDEVRLLQGSPAAQRVLDVRRMQEMLDAWPCDLNRNRAELDQRYNYTFGGAVALGRFLRRLEQGEIFPRN